VTRVVDGDTIDVQIDGTEYTVRYIGIDTPETVHPSQPVGCFGPEASARNKALVEGQTVGLEKDVSETDRFGRLLRYVWVGGEMVNAALVRDGYAQSSTYPPDVKHQDLFIELQRQAREAGRGLWGAVCTSPTAAPPAGAAGACQFSGTNEPVIKGNISSSSGERIYHVPGQRHYDDTVINEGAGERWFCTEQEAVAAGWRKAKV
jgi:micrococcal nuclease